MNVSGISYKNSNDNLTYAKQNKMKQEQSFGSSQLLSSVFMAINKHEILGVSAIDLLSMVIPRSIIDFTRNKEAGTETAIREASSTATHAAIGVAGLGASALLAQGLKHKNYNVDFKSLTANNDTVDALAETFKTVVDANPNATKKELATTFLNQVFTDVKGLGGNSNIPNSQVWFALKPENKKAIVATLAEQIEKNKTFKLPSNVANKLEAFLNFDIPSTQSLDVGLNGKTLATKGEHFINDAYSLTRSFLQDNVLAKFKSAPDIASNSFVQDLKKLSVRKAGLGLAAICAVALSMQSINRHLTQKRTGIKGFVGDPNYNKQNANEPKKKDATFLPLKLLSVLTMGFFIFKTVNAASLKDFISKVQFKGSLPTVNQIKVVYGSTILGRLIAASDKNELRESAFRDFLGYTNFLVLGALITKCFVRMKDKSLINYDAKTNGAGMWNWLKNSSIKTHEEVINSALKSDVISDKGVRSLKELYNNNWIRPGGKIAEKLGVLNKAKLIGMLYSCIALGIIIPLINKKMTEGKKAKVTVEDLYKQMVPQKELTPEELENIKKAQEIINNFLHRNLAA